MGILVAVLVGAIGVALIIAGVNNSALPFFETVIGPSSNAAKAKAKAPK